MVVVVGVWWPGGTADSLRLRCCLSASGVPGGSLNESGCAPGDPYADSGRSLHSRITQGAKARSASFRVFGGETEVSETTAVRQEKKRFLRPTLRCYGRLEVITMQPVRKQHQADVPSTPRSSDVAAR